jgi:hypothetical protein
MQRAEGFLYTKHPVLRPARPMVTRDPINDDAEMVGYAYTARRLLRPILATVPKARALKLVFGYAYTARYERIHGEQVHDGRIAA